MALSWGFNDISYFNRAFRTTYGMTRGRCAIRINERPGPWP
ncbi:hypothetical protein [Rhizobium sp. ICMP 5592]